jgi:hypothetical protein
VPRAGLRVFFVLVGLAHHRRRVIHFNVTEHPTATWAAQQIVDAFWDDSAPAYRLSAYCVRRREAAALSAFLGAKLVGEFELGDSVHAFDNRTDPVDRFEYLVHPLT